MRTRTFVAVAVGLALAVVAGAAIWALTGDDGDRRLGVVEQLAAGAAGVQMTNAGVNGSTPFAVNTYSVGGTQPLDPASKQATGQVRWNPLQFTRPLDDLASSFFQRASQGMVEQTVRLEVMKNIGGKIQPAVRYDFAPGVLMSGDEGGSGGNKAMHSLQLAYATPTLNVLSAVGYGGATGAVGRLEIPNVTDLSKPAYVLGYSWGWTVPGAAESAQQGVSQTGSLDVKSITIERALDLHAPWFWQQLAGGQAIPQMTLSLEGVDPKSTKPVAYATYTLSDVLVTEVQHSGNASELVQQIRLDFRQIQMKHGPRTASYSVSKG